MPSPSASPAPSATGWGSRPPSRSSTSRTLGIPRNWWSCACCTTSARQRRLVGRTAAPPRVPAGDRQGAPPRDPGRRDAPGRRLGPWRGGSGAPARPILWRRHHSHRSRAPGAGDRTGRGRRFAFMDWPDFDAALWTALLAEAEQQSSSQNARLAGRAQILASDRDAGAIEMAQANAARAGVADAIDFSCRPVSAVTPPGGPGWVVTNPPYGLRVGANRDLRNLYAQLGNVLRANTRAGTSPSCAATGNCSGRPVAPGHPPGPGQRRRRGRAGQGEGAGLKAIDPHSETILTALTSSCRSVRCPTRSIRMMSRQAGSGQVTRASVSIQSAGWLWRCLAGSRGSVAWRAYTQKSLPSGSASSPAKVETVTHLHRGGAVPLDRLDDDRQVVETRIRLVGIAGISREEWLMVDG